MLLHIGCIYVGDAGSVELCVLVEDVACWMCGLSLHFMCGCVCTVWCVCVCARARRHKRFFASFCFGSPPHYNLAKSPSLGDVSNYLKAR